MAGCIYLQYIFQVRLFSNQLLTLYLGHIHDDSRHKMEKVNFESTFKKLSTATGLQLFSKDLVLGKQVWF